MFKKMKLLLLGLYVFLNIINADSALALNLIYATDPAQNITPKDSALIVSRDENRTVVTILPRYSYDGDNFGILIPVPQLISDTQIKIDGADAAYKLLSYTAPRLAYYKDVGLCEVKEGARKSVLQDKKSVFKALSVKDNVLVGNIKADVKIIRSTSLEDQGLSELLKESNLYYDKDYQAVIDGYKERNVDFVLVTAPKQEGVYRSLPAIQIAYESDNFTLPIGLSGHSSDVAQDLTIVFITRDGLVSPKTMPLKKMVSDKNLPLFAADQFKESYEAIFKKSLLEDNFQSIFLEYAGDIKWCPNCTSAQKISIEDLRKLGAWWLDTASIRAGNVKVSSRLSDIDNVYLTRMHLRHTEKTILSSVDFVRSKDKNRFITSYNVHKPYLDLPKCELERLYRAKLPQQYQAELDDYVALTGLPVKDVKNKMESAGQKFEIPLSDAEVNWWERMWGVEATTSQ